MLVAAWCISEFSLATAGFVRVRSHGKPGKIVYCRGFQKPLASCLGLAMNPRFVFHPFALRRALRRMAGLSFRLFSWALAGACSGRSPKARRGGQGGNSYVSGLSALSQANDYFFYARERESFFGGFFARKLFWCFFRFGGGCFCANCQGALKKTREAPCRKFASSGDLPTYLPEHHEKPHPKAPGWPGR